MVCFGRVRSDGMATHAKQGMEPLAAVISFESRWRSRNTSSKEIWAGANESIAVIISKSLQCVGCNDRLVCDAS